MSPLNNYYTATNTTSYNWNYQQQWVNDQYQQQAIRNAVTRKQQHKREAPKRDTPTPAVDWLRSRVREICDLAPAA